MKASKAGGKSISNASKDGKNQRPKQVLMKERKFNLKKEMELDYEPENEKMTESEKEKRKKAFEKEKTSEEKFMEVDVSEIEMTNLKRVFNIFVGKKSKQASPKEDEENNDTQQDVGEDSQSFGAKDVRRVLKKLGVNNIREQDISIMIWEVDENLDKRVDENEFVLMYKKCIEDSTGLEARNLFNLVQFLMFCKPPEDRDGKPIDPELLDFNTTIKAEDTYFLIYGRLGRQNKQEENLLALLDKEIELIFGDKDDPEIEIDYPTYLKEVNKHALNQRLKGKKEASDKYR